MSHSRVPRWVAEAGATAVEYTLIFTALCFVSIGAAQYLSDTSDDQIDNQVDCISTRPPPASCQIRPVTTTSSTVTTIVVTSTVPPPTPTTGTWGTPSVVPAPAPFWDASVPITLMSGSSPVEGAVVTVQVFNAPSGPTQFVSCTTNASGTCTLVYEVPFAATEDVTFTISSVNSNPPWGGTLSPVSFNNPNT